MIQFEWDENKNRVNRSKHGVWFEEASSVFKDPLHRFFTDHEHSDKEDRFIIIGLSSGERVLVVSHTYRKNLEIVRIISARKAKKKERRYHEEGI